MKTPEQLRREFWENDIMLHGGVIFNQYNEIKEVLANNDWNWVEKQYSIIKEYATKHTKFYQNYKHDMEFPVIDKLSIIDNYESHKSSGDFELPIHISSTSGSTGTPFSAIQDYRKRMRNIADLKVFGERCNYLSHERMIFLRVLSEKLHRTQEQEDRENIYYIDSSCLSEKSLESITKEIIKKNPKILLSYSSTLVELAKYIRSSDYSDKITIKSILAGGEGLSEDNRILLESVFKGTVYRRYSNMELGILGQDMGGGGPYYLNWGSYYFECLKENSNEPAEEGEVGRIVITDLFNKAMPIIRYDTGDLGIMQKFSDGRLPVLKEVYGRKRDCVYSTNGELLSPAKISVSMWGENDIKQWQFIQETKNGYILKLNCNKNMETRNVIDKLTKILGADAQITVEFVEEIPVTSSNKRRAVVCNYQRTN